MITAPARLTFLTLFATASTWLAGCASVSAPAWLEEEGPTLSEQREARAEEVVEKFEERRAEAELKSAESAMERGELPACETTLRELIARRPGFAPARLLLADVLLMTDRRAEAVKHAELALREDPNNPAVHYSMGLLLDAAGQRAGAISYYKRATDLSPENELYASAYRTAERIATAHLGASPPEQIQEAADPSPSGVVGRVDGNSPNASTDTTTAVKATDTPISDEVRALFAQAEQVARADDPTELGRILRDAVARCPDNPHVPVRASVLALKHDQPTLAAEILTSAARCFPQDPRIHRALGVACYRQGAVEEAEVAFRKALSLDNADSLSYFLLGCTLAKNGQTEAARQQFSRAAQLDARADNVLR